MQNKPRLFYRGFLFLPFFQRHIVFNFLSRHLKHGKQIQVHSVPEYPQHHFGAFDFQDVFNLFDGCAARTADHFLNNRDGFVQVAIHFLSFVVGDASAAAKQTKPETISQVQPKVK